MAEIKVSQKGINYAEPCILKQKKFVHSEAMLMKIPHEHPEKQDIALKIGRYKNPFGELENKKPKSELTFDNDELNALIEYISDNYVPVNIGKGEYINIDGSNSTLIRRFKQLIDTEVNIAEMLIDNDILSDNILVAVNTIKKKNSLFDFCKNLELEKPESFWQNWFTENKWILGSDFVQIIDERRLNTENIADYIMRAFDGFVDLVEIKKPNGLPFWSNTKDHNNYVPSSDLIKAITQCLNYLYVIERESNSVSFSERIGGKVIKPRCTLIFGRSNDWNNEQKEAYRILNSSYSQLSIITYDHLLLRAQNILGIEEMVDD